jgi:FkbM family methyltransferase
MPVLSEAAVRLLAELRGEGRPIHVLDVGANPLEEPSYKGLLDLGLARVTGFEPQPAALAELNRTKGPNETYLPYAVGDGSEGTLHIMKGSGFTSLFAPFAPVARLLGFKRGMNVLATEPMATRRLDEMAEVDRVDFLKIDVQGAELAILKHGREKLAGAMAVQTEVRLLPIYRGEPRFGALDAELARQGFAFHDFHLFNRKALASENARRLAPEVAERQIVDADAIYLRDLARPRALSDDQLFVLAILGTGVLERPGVTVHALDLLRERGRVAQGDIERWLAALPPEMLAAPRAGRKAAPVPVTAPAPAPAEARAGQKVLFTAVKNEGPFLLEWVAYHRAIGFDRVVVYHNDCDDGTAELLAALAAAGVVEARAHHPGPGVAAQGNAARLANEAGVFGPGDWVIWLDADEFLNIHAGAGRVDDLIAAMGPHLGLLVPWRLFGDGGAEGFGGRFLSERFTRAALPDREEPPEIKAFFRMGPHVAGLGTTSIHRPLLRPGSGVGAADFLGGNGQPLVAEFKANVKWFLGRDTGQTRLTDPAEFGWDLAQVNHYLVRTPALYLMKKARGDGWRVGHADRRLTEAFYRANNRNEGEDRSILRHEAAVTEGIAALRALPGVAQAEALVAARLAERLAALGAEAASFAAAVHAPEVAEAEG